jgi:hypothetical protein
MDHKHNFKAIAAWMILGYICVIFINSIETILQYISEAILNHFFADSQIKYFSDVIPYLLILIFWILLVFIYLKDFDANKVIEKFPKKFTKYLAISSIFLYSLLYGIRILSGYSFLNEYSGNTPPEKTILEINTLILATLSYAQIIVIIIGLIKIVKKNALPLTPG